MPLVVAAVLCALGAGSSCGPVGVADFEQATGEVKPACGDGVCRGKETCSSCPTDCGACPSPSTGADAGSIATDAGSATPDAGMADAGPSTVDAGAAPIDAGLGGGTTGDDPSLADGVLYSPTALINQPIPATAGVDPRSAVIAQGIRDEVAAHGAMISWRKWGKPLYFVHGSTAARYSVRQTEWPIGSTTYLDGVPIPDGALPDPGGSGCAGCGVSNTDGHMMIIDDDAASPTYGCSYELFDAVKNPDGTWSAGSIVRSLATGSDGIYDNGPDEGTVGPLGSSFYGGMGPIRPEELQRGRINHALAFAYGRNQKGVVARPSYVSDGDYTGTDALPEGARIRLDPSVDLSSLPRAWQIIGQALKDYGAFDTDNSGGGLQFVALNNAVSPIAWGYGVAYPWTDDYPQVPALIVDHLQVMDLGTLYPNQFVDPPLSHRCGNYR